MDLSECSGRNLAHVADRFIAARGPTVIHARWQTESIYDRSEPREGMKGTNGATCFVGVVAVGWRSGTKKSGGGLTAKAAESTRVHE